MSCPKFLKTINLNDFIVDLFEYYNLKTEAKSLAWIGYDFSEANAAKSYGEKDVWNSFHYKTLNYKISNKENAFNYPLMSKSIEKVKKNSDGTYNFCFTICYRGNALGYFVFDHMFIEETVLFVNEVEKFFNSLSEQLFYCIEFAKLSEMAYRDDLTSFYNQRYLNDNLKHLIKSHRLQKKEMSVLFIDLDHFKFINDNFGHVVGSKLLVEVSNIINESLRIHDLGVRYGGDEFVIIFPDIDERKAQKFAEKIRSDIESADFIIESRKIKITASIGLASYPGNASTADQIIKIADQAMYDAKSKSRNTVYIAS